MTFADLVTHWRRDVQARHKPSTREREDYALSGVLLPAFGGTGVRDLSPHDIHGWFESYGRRAPIGANRSLDILRAILEYGIRCGEVDAPNPAGRIEKFPCPARTRFLSRAEVRRVHGVLDAHVGRGQGQAQADIIRLLLLTGCRKMEIAALRWSEVADGETALRLRDSKSGPRTVWLSPAASAILARQRETRNGSPWVFPSRSGKPRRDIALWRKVVRDADLEGVRLHDLRHTFASHAVMRGVPIPVLSRLLGHADSQTTMRYAHLADRHVAEAAEKVGGGIARLLGGG